ncbi:MAG: HlyD family efflux transporter periplasmic adaptor subunit [Caldilineae bacterium]|nr:MAG: HlyD family efflux transporter periplasmic adaptor subunit [Caldilineae bacterium]
MISGLGEGWFLPQRAAAVSQDRPETVEPALKNRTEADPLHQASLPRRQEESALLEPAGAGPAEPPPVYADGYVLPIRWARLSVAAPGTVNQIYVEEGQQVEAGAPLLLLENKAQIAGLAQAQAALQEAEAALALLKAGAREEEIIQAQAAVDAAQARLERLLAGPTAEQIATAQKAVAVAQAQLERVRAGATPGEIAAAEANLKLAEARRKQAQARYDEVAWRSDISRLPQSLELEQATIEYTRALAQYNDLVDGPTPEEIRVYEAQVEQAQAQLAELTAPPHPADVAAARADAARAQAALALLQAGPRPEEIAQAQARVIAASAAVEQARAAVNHTVLRAPFAGTIGAIYTRVGEYIAPAQPVIELGDMRAWVVETDDLSELEVVHLEVGDRMRVTFDALPEQALTGVVTAIQPASELKRGDVTYTVRLALEGDAQILARLRWGMTAVVSGPENR